MPRVTGSKPAPSAPPATPAALLAAPPVDDGPYDPMTALGLTPLEEANEYTNAMYFGDAGSGKTTAMAFLANLPGDGMTVIINAEGGIKKAALKALGVDTSRVMLWPDRDKGEVITYASLETLLFRLRDALRRQPGSIKGVGFDSGTELVATLMLEITTYAYNKEQALPQIQKDKKIAEGKALRENVHSTQLQDYGMLTNQGRTLLRSFRDLGCHFVITALEKDDAVNEVGAKAAIGPELPNKLSASVRGYMDLVLRLTAETVKTGPTAQETMIKAETKQSLTRQCKDRDGLLPFELLNPTFDRVRAYVTGELTEDTDPEIAHFREIRAEAAKYVNARKRAA